MKVGRAESSLEWSRLSPQRLLSLISRLKLDPERGPPPTDRETHAAFAAYQERLQRDDALDLDFDVDLQIDQLRRHFSTYLTTGLDLFGCLRGSVFIKLAGK